jgi:hypothetical protein
VALTSWRVEGGQLLLVCSACGVQHSVAGAAPSVPAPSPSAPPAPSRLASSPVASNVVALRPAAAEAIARAVALEQSDPFAVPSGVCPKCIAKRPPAATSCHHCGLVFDRLTAEALEVPDWLSTAWRGLLRDWGDERRHDQLRTEAGLRDGLASLARLYRLRLADCPEDPFAKRARDELLRQATASMSAPRVTTEIAAQTNSILKWVALLALIGTLVLGAVLVVPRLMGS